jgi:hypothetical protein
MSKAVLERIPSVYHKKPHALPYRSLHIAGWLRKTFEIKACGILKNEAYFCTPQ